MRRLPPWIRIVAFSSTARPDILRDALTVRNTVFGEEEQLLSKPDQDEYDGLSTTIHIVIYAYSWPVATARIILSNGEIARVLGRHFGIGLEDLFDLSPVKELGRVVAESGRVAVLKKHRATVVSQALLASITWVARQAGVDILVAAANTETDATDSVWLMARVISARQLKSRLYVIADAPSDPPDHPRKLFYEAEHWKLAEQGRLRELPLPRTLKLFLLKQKGRVMGDPLYLPEFSRWAFPILALVSRMPESPFDLTSSLEHQVPRAT